jgi:hypothetical protein
MTWPFARLWDEAWTFDEFIARAAPQHRDLWQAVHRLAKVPEWALVEARTLPPLRLVVLTEDWCGDAVNTLPVLAKWAAAAAIPLRVLRRDAYPEVMDRYLTNGARAIPVVIVLTSAMDEVGWWGPRPRALQEWVGEQRRAGRDQKELYPEIRRWYARDKGETTLREVLAVAAGARHTEAVPSP